MRNYLKEAFKQLDLLNEDVFPVDKDGMDKLQKFLDGDTTDTTETVIDPEAETEDQLKDSYEGKVILCCDVCESLHYESPEDVVFDEESDLVDVGTECPVCFSTSGYSIVGQVAPYTPHVEENNSDADNSKEEVTSEPIEESKNDGKSITDRLLANTSIIEESGDDNEPKKKKGRSREESTYFYVAQGMLDGGFYTHKISDKTGKVQTQAVKQLYDPYDIGVDDAGIFVWVTNEDDAQPAQGVADKLGLETHLDDPIKFVRGKNRKFHLYIPQDKWDEDVPEDILNEAMNEAEGTIYDKVLKVLDDNGYDTQDEDVMAYAASAAEYIETARAETDGHYSVSQWFKDTQQNYPEDLKELKRLEETCEKKAMTECVDNVEVEADGQKVEVKTEEDKTVIEISTEQTDEVIVPVSEETKEEIASNENNFDENDISEIDLDNIVVEPEEFDNLGESYLKKVYENVDSFKTTSVKNDNKKLIVEGLISFKSGKVSKTRFVFENLKQTKSGKVKILGEGLQFSNNKKAFSLTGTMKDNKFICESFTYNYTAKDSKTGKSFPLYGTIKR